MKKFTKIVTRVMALSLAIGITSPVFADEPQNTNQEVNTLWSIEEENSVQDTNQDHKRNKRGALTAGAALGIACTIGEVITGTSCVQYVRDTAKKNW